jgi:hypothetical protein
MRKGVHRAAGCALAALAAALCSAVTAATPAHDGASIVPDRERKDNQRAQRIMAGWAECAATPWRSDLTGFLNAFPRSPASHAAAHRLTSSYCLETDFATLRFDEDLLRGALFNILYRRNFAAGPAPDIRSAAPIDYTVGSITAESRGAAWHITRWNYADCVVRAAPDRARALILSEVAGAGETEAFRALRPELVSCMPTGAAWRFTRPILRGLIAETLYRLSAARAGLPAFGGAS